MVSNGDWNCSMMFSSSCAQSHFCSRKDYVFTAQFFLIWNIGHILKLVEYEIGLQSNIWFMIMASKVLMFLLRVSLEWIMAAARRNESAVWELRTLARPWPTQPAVRCTVTENVLCFCVICMWTVWVQMVAWLRAWLGGKQSWPNRVTIPTCVRKNWVKLRKTLVPPSVEPNTSWIWV